MNKKGFILAKLMVVLAVLALGIAFTLPFSCPKAHGMELQKLLPADDDAVKTVIETMKRDRYLTVIIMAYSPEWTMDTVDPILDKARKVLDTFHNAGIYANRITMLFANKGGLVEDALPTPATEGVYLYLD